MPTRIKINRAPVLTLWTVVVAERLGHSHDTALTLGKAVARLNAEAKGQRLGIIDEKSESEETEARAKEEAAGPEYADLLGRKVPVVESPQGKVATLDGEPVDPRGVERYLQQKFKGDLDDVRAAMQALALAYAPPDLAKKAYGLYERFRPAVPEGEKGWGAAGELDLDYVRSLAG